MTVAVAGVGTDTLTDSVLFFQETGQIVFGLEDATTRWGFTVLAFNCYVYCGSYDYLTAPLPLVSGTHTIGGGIYNTTHGALLLTNSPNSVNF